MHKEEVTCLGGLVKTKIDFKVDHLKEKAAI